MTVERFGDGPAAASLSTIRESLLSAMAASDDSRYAQAYLSFCERHYLAVASMFHEFLSSSNVDDAVQDFFVVMRSRLRSDRARFAIKKMRDDDNGAKRFKGFVRTCAKNVARDFVRRCSKYQFAPVSQDLEAAMSETSQRLLESEQLETIAAVGRLVISKRLGVSVRDWGMFEAELLGESREKVAQRFQSTVRAVDQAAYRARKALRQLRPVLDELGIIDMLAD